MQIIFDHLYLKNFMSVGEGELSLRNNNYCLVKGINHYKKDNALSNGSGKSTWSNAICWCLCGECLNGVSSGVKNLMVPEKECWVELSFIINNDKYVVKRIREPKPDMTISLNGKDISGKGIRESEAILANQLPEITVSLLASVIILGQGLPYKFTTNSPSGRKEVLEKLTKSDFMIQDIKDRITKRDLELRTELRSIEDAELVAKTSYENHCIEKLKCEQTLEVLTQPVNYDKTISETSKKIEDIETSITEINTKKTDLSTQLKALQAQYYECTAAKAEDIKELDGAFNQVEVDYVNNKNAQTLEYNSKITGENTKYQTGLQELADKYNEPLNNLQVKVNTLSAQITEAKNIKDTCPTCGQKLPGVFKKDTSELEAQLKAAEAEKIKLNNEMLNVKKALQESYIKTTQQLKVSYDDAIKTLNEEINTKRSKKNAYSQDIQIKYAAKLQELTEAINVLTLQDTGYTQQLNTLNTTLKGLQNTLNQIKTEQASIQTRIDINTKYLNEHITQIETLTKSLENSANNKAKLQERINIISKMNSLVKRDFRGYLLSGIINYINTKCKEYCLDIFGTDELDFVLSGNSIDISYLNKPFENLSGGEKQRVDLIIQFAIRDMMTSYLDFSSNILILDEITDALDATSCDAVMNLIATKLSDLESIYIISHHADELSIPYDSEIVVEKDQFGISSIRQH